jgi:arsenite methyltransferase
MTNISFGDEMARLQRALAQCHDMVVRRSVVLEALNLRTGEKVLELGCGGGFYAYEAGQFVGSTGHVTAIDISADQIGAARERCVELPWVEWSGSECDRSSPRKHRVERSLRRASTRIRR